MDVWCDAVQMEAGLESVCEARMGAERDPDGGSRQGWDKEGGKLDLACELTDCALLGVAVDVAVDGVGCWR